MAYFKFRKSGEEAVAPAPIAESVEVIRTRARHRLIGTAVLVMAGVIGFPLLFDSQPRPLAVDIPIDIPDRNALRLRSVAPESAAGPVVTESDAGRPVEPVSRPVEVSAPAVPASVGAAPVDDAGPSRAASGAVVGAQGASPVVAKPVENPAVPKPVAAKPVAKPSSVPVPNPALPERTDDGAKARALLEGRTLESARPAVSVPAVRLVVQVGAYGDAAKSQEVRWQLERSGLKTYAQVVEGKDGKRYRVRLGPFGSRAEAERVADKIRKLDLPAAILEL